MCIRDSFSVLRSVPLPRRLSGMLEAESGFNDAPVVILTTALALQLTGAEPVSYTHLDVYKSQRVR